MNYVVRWDEAEQKFDKFPCDVHGRVVDAHSPANWVDYATAAAVATYDTASSAPYGIAFVLSSNDPWFFLDLDKCRNDDGSWTQAATAIFTSFTGAAGEISVSGNGLHVMGKCRPEMLQDRKHKWDGWLEFYTEGRFIAFGQGFAPINGQFNPDLDWTDMLRRFVPERPLLGELPEGVDPAYTGPTDDTELVRKMLMSAGGAAAAFGGKATVAQLWNADPILAQMYPAYDGNPQHFDRSAADAALMAHLAFWTGKDMPRMERLFRQSALMRPKFDRDDYRLKTVQDAARMCNRVYDRPRKQEQQAPAAMTDVTHQNHEAYMTIPEMQQHFQGCTYILSLHKVLTPDGSLLKHEQFKAYYGGHMFQMMPDGTQPEKNAFIAFTENRAWKFPKVKDAVFDPSREPGDIRDDKVNTYFRVDVDMTPGDVTPFLDFLKKLLPYEMDRQIILAWMASCVQNPHHKFQWAPVLQGTEGNGKTFVMNCVAHAIGNEYVHRPNPRELTEKFNEWVERSLFVLVEEVHMEGRRDVLDSLKTSITNEILPIRGMAQSERMAKNFSKWGFCTNYQDAVIKSKNDRRYAIFFTAQQSEADLRRDGMDGLYFPHLYEWAKNGGYAAVAHYLATYAIPAELDPAGAAHRAPRTSSTDAAIAKTTGHVEAEIIEATQDGTKGFMGGWISAYALDCLVKRRNLRVSLNKRSEILEAMGYIRCPGLPAGRSPKTLIWEDNKRPVLWMVPGMPLSDDPVKDYLDAQGYTMSQMPR